MKGLPSVKCYRCGKGTLISHEELRVMVESGKLPTCYACSLAKTHRPEKSKGDMLVEAMTEVLAGASASISHIAMIVWKRHPLEFGLPHFERDHPCSKRVELVIRGCVRTGRIEKSGRSTYRIKPKGDKW